MINLTLQEFEKIIQEVVEDARTIKCSDHLIVELAVDRLALKAGKMLREKSENE